MGEFFGLIHISLLYSGKNYIFVAYPALSLIKNMVSPTASRYPLFSHRTLDPHTHRMHTTEVFHITENTAPWYARGYHPRSFMSCHPEHQSSYGIPHLHGGKSPSQGNELDEDSTASSKEETEEDHKEMIPKKNSALSKCRPMEGPVPSKFWG